MCPRVKCLLHPLEKPGTKACVVNLSLPVGCRGVLPGGPSSGPVPCGRGFRGPPLPPPTRPPPPWLWHGGGWRRWGGSCSRWAASGRRRSKTPSYPFFRIWLHFLMSSFFLSDFHIFFRFSLFYFSFLLSLCAGLLQSGCSVLPHSSHFCFLHTTCPFQQVNIVELKTWSIFWEFCKDIDFLYFLQKYCQPY